MAKDSANDVSRQRRRGEKIPDGSACLVCGIHDRVVLETHHLAGWRNDETLTAVVCRNHHAVATEDLRVAGVPMTEPRSPFDALIAVLAGVAEFLHRLADRLAAWSEWLVRVVELLDLDHPLWRASLTSLPSVDDLTNYGVELT